MGKGPSQRKRNSKSNKTEAILSKSFKPNKVENFSKQNNTGHELGKADKSHLIRRKLLACLMTVRTREVLCLIAMACLMSLIDVDRLLSDYYQLEAHNWQKRAHRLLSDCQVQIHRLVPYRFLQLLKSLQSSKVLSTMLLELAFQLLFIACIAVQPVLALLASKRNPIDQRPLPPNPLDRRPLPPNPEGLIPPFRRLQIGEEIRDGTKSLSLHVPIKQKQDPKKNAKQKSLKTESKALHPKQRTETVNSRQKNKGKQEQEDTTQATRTDTSAIKGSVIHNESSRGSTGHKRDKVTSISQNSLIQKPPLAESQERKTENIANPRQRQTKQIEVKPKATVQKPVISVTGLLNLGNTCFFNATMQNLNQSFVLGELLSEQKLDLPLTKSMVDFYKQMTEMSSKENKQLNPSLLFASICNRSPKFKGGKQQDSHELLRHLLDGLRNEERQVSTETEKRKVLTKVDKVFGGHFLTIYTCNDCTKPYHVLEPFLDISLPIQQHQFNDEEEYNIDEDTTARQTKEDELNFHNAAKFLMTPLNRLTQESQDTGKSCSSTKRSDSNPPNCKRKRSEDSAAISGSRKRNRTEGCPLLDCLNAFTRTESITKEYLCIACHEKRCSQDETDYQMSSAIKRTLVFNPPALLTLHLKRFSQTSRGFVKCNNMITFPDMLDLGPYCSSCCLRNDGNEKNIWYSLYGVVVHGGDLSGGHYTAYVKLRTQDVNTKQFLQNTFLDRDKLTEEKLVEMVRVMKTRLQQNQIKEWRPQEAVQGIWFYVSDSHCAQVHENEVFQRPAYLLFYERMTRPPDDLH